METSKQKLTKRETNRICRCGGSFGSEMEYGVAWGSQIDIGKQKNTGNESKHACIPVKGENGDQRERWRLNYSSEIKQNELRQ